MRLNRHWFVVLSILLAFRPATPAWAWGRLGDRVVSRFSESRLTPAAKAGIATLLEAGELCVSKLIDMKSAIFGQDL